MEVTTAEGATVQVFKVDSPVQIVVSGPDALKERVVLWAPHRRKPIEPSIELVFTLADVPASGTLTLTSNSWALAHDLAENGLRDALATAKRPCLVSAQLVLVSFLAKNGINAGQLVSYERLRLVPLKAPESSQNSPR